MQHRSGSGNLPLPSQLFPANLAVMDFLTPTQRSERMRRIRGKNTKPELQLRKELHRRGLRYRIHGKDLPGKPDIVFKGIKLAIQVRGCFWHMHDCKIGHIPKSRRSYWREKLIGNANRDKLNDKSIKKMGWRLVVVWECEINRAQTISKKTEKITALVLSRKRCARK